MDERRELLLGENRVEWYINRGQGAIFANAEDAHGLNPFELVEFAYERNPDIFHHWVSKIQNMSLEPLKSVLNRIPDSFISELERTFALKMLAINLNRLKKLIV